MAEIGPSLSIRGLSDFEPAVLAASKRGSLSKGEPAREAGMQSGP